MKRLMRPWRDTGDAVLVRRQRGQRSNRSMASDFRAVPEDHPRGQYQGFGATLAAEKLLERDEPSDRVALRPGGNGTGLS